MTATKVHRCDRTVPPAGTGYDTGVAVGDYDNDGFQDVCGSVHRNTLYRNKGDGTFADDAAADLPGPIRSSGRCGP
jgi:hypothetical protein